MIVCRMKMETESNGNKLLTGMLGYALEQGAIIVLRKIEDEYCLIAVSVDGRQPHNTQQTLGSFMDTTVPCSWCPGKTEKNHAVLIVGSEKRIYLCAECSEFEQFKKYKHRTRIGGPDA